MSKDPTTNAVSAPPAPFPDLDIAVADFRRLVPDEIEDDLLSLSGAGSPGTLTVRWKGPVPKPVSDLAGTELGGLVVEVIQADLSQSEVFAIADKIIAASAAGALPEVAFVVADVSGSGLSIHVPADLLEARSATDLGKTFEAFAGLPVTVRVGEAPQQTSRQNDGDPWRGGMTWQWPTHPADYDFCSTAFAVVGAGGYGHLLSARHCDPSGDLALNDAHGDGFTAGGDQVDTKAVDDTMRINPIGGTQGLVYGGGPSQTPGTANYSLNVVGADTSAEGGIVCSDGANSGMHCSLHVTNDAGDTGMATWACGSSTCHGWHAHIVGPATAPATVGGDSGGPVFHNWGNDTVGARGVVYGGSDPVACGTVARPVTNCFATVWFTDIERLLDTWGVTIETVP